MCVATSRSSGVGETQPGASIDTAVTIRGLTAVPAVVHDQVHENVDSMAPTMTRSHGPAVAR